MYKILTTSILLGGLFIIPAALADDTTYGRIKELTSSKLVVDVDNAPDKSFDLAKETVALGRDLKVGDPVRLLETKINGKTTWDVAKDAHSGEKHGDKSRSETLGTDVTYGRIKEHTAAKLVVDVDNGIDKSFDLAKEPVSMPATLKVGDPVRMVEQKINGTTKWTVALDDSGVKHGDKTRSEAVRDK